MAAPSSRHREEVGLRLGVWGEERGRVPAPCHSHCPLVAEEEVPSEEGQGPGEESQRVTHTSGKILC